MATDKISNICVDSISTKCVDYKGKLGVKSTFEAGCINQFEVNEDLYTVTDNIINSLDTSGLSSSCLTYPLTDNEITLKSVIEIQDQEICSLKVKVQNLENETLEQVDISNLGLDFACLVDSCGDPITNLKTLLQLLINKSCNI